jgi:phage I-like protein
MNRTAQVAIYLLVTFVSGAVVGVFGHQFYLVTASANQKIAPEQYRNRMREAMQKRLKLDGAQVGKVDAAMEAARNRWRAFRERHRDEIAEMDAQLDAEMAAILSPEQELELGKMKKERDAKRKEVEQKSR